MSGPKRDPGASLESTRHVTVAFDADFAAWLRLVIAQTCREELKKLLAGLQ
jgi:hypothetical protein